MRKIIIYIGMSLDGYIAEETGAVDFLAGDGSDDANQGTYPQFIETVDTIILGYTTYHQLITELSPNEWVYCGKRTYVITHQKKENKEEIIFTSEPLALLLERLKNENGKDIWICGGASIVNQVLQTGLVDKITVSIIPTILGKGIPLFENRDNPIELEFISTAAYNGIVDLVYQCKK